MAWVFFDAAAFKYWAQAYEVLTSEKDFAEIVENKQVASFLDLSETKEEIAKGTMATQLANPFFGNG